MFSRIRPEPRLPIGLSLLLVLAIGTYEASHYQPVYDPGPAPYLSALIDAELAAHPFGQSYVDVSGTSARAIVADYMGNHTTGQGFKEVDSLVLKPLFRGGRADGFSLSLVPDTRARCELLVALPDRRVTRTLVNGQVVREGLNMPSGYATQKACSMNSGEVVTLEVSLARA